ncbi:MAG: hypothetical protein ABSF52_14005 [Syntrophobacteraceae bacterium]
MGLLFAMGNGVQVSRTVQPTDNFDTPGDGAVEYDISANRQASQAFRQLTAPAAHGGLGGQRLKFLLNRFNKSIRPGRSAICANDRLL